MTTTHRTLDGDWAVCPAPAGCDLRFHFPDMTPAQLAAVPEAILWDMLEIVDPPQLLQQGFKFWYVADADSEVIPHRDYDLPALIDDTVGEAKWIQHGQLHRGGGRPALIRLGTPGWERINPVSLTKDETLRPRRQWWTHGIMTREEIGEFGI